MSRDERVIGNAGRTWILHHTRTILFLAACLCVAGAYAARHMPSSVFPQTDFPRVVLLIDNGVMPADEMMATITRPVEETMKEIPGTRDIRSATGRGAAEVNVFFDWSTDMVEAELYVLGRLAQIRSTLPPEATFEVHRLTFSAFPVLGVSLTSTTREATALWELARYELEPRLLRLPGVARVKLIGGAPREAHVIVDPAALEARHLSLANVAETLRGANLLLPAGMHEEDRQLYLSVVDNRLRSLEEIGAVTLLWDGAAPVRVRDVARVEWGAAPVYNIVTADGSDAVLFNIYGQTDSDTLGLASAVRAELDRMRSELSPDLRLGFFYDQSQFVREGVRSVWESILIGLGLSALVLFGFLKNARATFIALAVIPVTVLSTLAGMRVLSMSFNLMTLGGIAAAIGLVIDDAIVVVEAVHAEIAAGNPPARAVGLALREVGWALVGSTLTPIVVFLPLSFLDGVAGVFFRALALTMVLSLAFSLFYAVTWTPSLSAFMGARVARDGRERGQGGPILRVWVRLYEWALRRALAFLPLTVLLLVAVGALGVVLYRALDQDFLPEQDEGAFVLDYFSRPGTSLSETNRMLEHVEEILVATPEVEGYSRRTGARLALAIAEPNTGDFLVKLRARRTRSTTEVIDELREKITAAEPALTTEFPGVLSDLIGDLTWSPNPVEIKVFTTDTEMMRNEARRIAGIVEGIPGVVDLVDGLVVAGSSLSFRVRDDAAARAGTSVERVGADVATALLGQPASHLLVGDRTIPIRVLEDVPADTPRERLLALPIRTGNGAARPLDQWVAAETEAGLLEKHRENLRQLVAVSARFSGVDLGTGIHRIQEGLAAAGPPPGGVHLEYGGLYEQQQESFRNLAWVLVMAILLVYGVLLAEFRHLLPPLSIVIGAVLALVGVEAALWWTGTSLNIISFLGAIIGVGLVAKNGILMLDHVERLRGTGLSFREALIRSGRRRLRPVLMTSLTAFLGLLPLAFGIGAGADMLRPLAIGVMGALSIALPLSLLATPVSYYVLMSVFHPRRVRDDAT